MAWIVRFAIAGVLSCACASTTEETYPADLTHPNYVKRSRAVRRFAVEKDVRPLEEGRAWDLLRDEEGGIRSVAHKAIRDLTPGRRDFGYAPDLPPDVRDGVAARWEAWWRKSQEASGG